MGRSVSYLTYAEEVTYFVIDPTNDEGLIDTYDEDDNEITRQPDQDDYDWCYEDFIGNIKHSLMAKFPSLEEADEWAGNEERIFLKSSLVEIGVATYMGLASISIRINDDCRDWDYNNLEGLAKSWIDKNWDKMVKVMGENTYHQRLNRTGTMSNGVSVYQTA